MKESSICWNCKKCYGGCSWSKDFIPVENWEADFLTLSKGSAYQALETYIVKKCPEFESDKTENRGK